MFCAYAGEVFVEDSNASGGLNPVSGLQRFGLYHVWPRAESNIYAEPKRLVEAGLATAETQSVGRRARTLYTIAPEGRRALEHWLGTESAPSRFESETLVGSFSETTGRRMRC
jgi:PadR family transcriptional regulator, regulatory protein AphA